MVNYLKAMLGDARHDVLFCGYQAEGTPGRDILEYGPKGGYVVLDGERIDIRAGIHRIDGFSAHADQGDLLRFAACIRSPPRIVRVVHGAEAAKARFAALLRQRLPQAQTLIP